MSGDDAAAVRSWDHSVVPVMDLWRAERFYTEVLDGAIFHKVGMAFRPGAQNAQRTFVDPAGAFIKLGRHHLGLFLQTQEPVHAPADLNRGAPCWALAVAEADFSAVVDRVRATGLPVGDVRTELYGTLQCRSVRCTDSEGNCLELVADPRGRHDERSVTGLSHIHFETSTVVGTTEFYCRILGLNVLDGGPDWVALGLPSEQAVVFHEVAELAPAMVGPYYGRHFAFHVDTATFHAIVARLRAAGIEEGDALGRSVPGEFESYFYDPNNPSLWLQILNKTSAQAAEGRVRLKYTAA